MATPDVESWQDKLELLATELEGELIPKTQLLDVEDDLDNIDEFVKETPYDHMMTEAMNNEQPDHEAPSSSSRTYDKIDDILTSVDDLEMKNELEKWIYKYTQVFNDELTKKHAQVPAFKLDLGNCSCE